MVNKPQIKNDLMYQLLREGNVEEFNRRKAAGETCDLTHSDFRSLDLRGLDARGLDMSHAYFHQTDMRGLDLSETKLEGASINGARISGVYFPTALSADEINLSLMHGTRLRYGS